MQINKSLDYMFNRFFMNPNWVIKEYILANIPCAIFNSELVTGNPFQSFHMRGDRHNDIDNIAVAPKYFDTIKHLLEPNAPKKFYNGEAALVVGGAADFDLATYRADWAQRLVHQRRAVLLKQTKDWFHMRSDDQPNNLCGPLRIMGGRHKITGALTNQISLIQTDHRVRIVILSPTPIKHLPLLRISSWSMDHLVFHPPTSREDA